MTTLRNIGQCLCRLCKIKISTICLATPPLFAMNHEWPVWQQPISDIASRHVFQCFIETHNDSALERVLRDENYYNEVRALRPKSGSLQNRYIFCTFIQSKRTQELIQSDPHQAANTKWERRTNKIKQLQNEQMTRRAGNTFTERCQLCYQNVTEYISNIHNCLKTKTNKKDRKWNLT